MAEYELVINYKKCTGCRICEQVCAIRNSLVANPEKARIRIVNLKEQANVVSIPVRCLQCEEPICETVCPTRAISTDSPTGARMVNTKKCMGCRTCVYTCPFGAAAFDRSAGTVFMCNLCEGDPLCARWCPFGALEYIRSDEASIRLKKDAAIKLLDSLSLSLEQVGYKEV
jgi:Fe-S-cluster-containing dehydrogenase component